MADGRRRIAARLWPLSARALVELCVFVLPSLSLSLRFVLRSTPSVKSTLPSQLYRVVLPFRVPCRLRAATLFCQPPPRSFRARARARLLAREPSIVSKFPRASPAPGRNKNAAARSVLFKEPLDEALKLLFPRGRETAESVALATVTRLPALPPPPPPLYLSVAFYVAANQLTLHRGR